MTKKFFYNTILFLVTFLAGVTGCKKGSPDSSLLVLEISNKMGADSIVLDSTYQNPLGRNISFSRIEYYLSDIELTRDDNYMQPVSGVVLVTTQTSQYIMGSVPVGTYKKVSFKVGLVDTINHVDPSYYFAGPLGAQSPSMHFSTDNLGYIFVAAEGLVDTSVSGTGMPNKLFSYHIGVDSLLRQVNLPDHSSAPYNAAFISAGNHILTIHIAADFSVFLQNMDMKANPITNTSDYPSQASSLASHIPAMFTYQQ